LVTDYPVSQAALARLRPDGLTAARVRGLLPGVSSWPTVTTSWVTPDEQAARFSAGQPARDALGLERPCSGESGSQLARRRCRHGLPDCSGVAVGLDRALLLRLGRARTSTRSSSFSFRALLKRSGRDPAVLLCLDQAQSHRDRYSGFILA
jgi:lysyl-tRNA synthetase class 2